MEFPTRLLPDGRQMVVYPLFFDRARLGVGPAGPAGVGGFDDVW